MKNFILYAVLLILLSMCKTERSMPIAGPYTFPPGTKVESKLMYNRHLAVLTQTWSTGTQDFDAYTLLYFEHSGDILAAIPFPPEESWKPYSLSTDAKTGNRALTQVILGKDIDYDGIPCSGGYPINFSYEKEGNKNIYAGCKLSKDVSTVYGKIEAGSLVSRDLEGVLYQERRKLAKPEVIWGLTFPPGVEIAYRRDRTINIILINKMGGALINNQYYPDLTIFRLDESGNIITQDIYEYMESTTGIDPRKKDHAE